MQCQTKTIMQWQPHPLFKSLSSVQCLANLPKTTNCTRTEKVKKRTLKSGRTFLLHLISLGMLRDAFFSSICRMMKLLLKRKDPHVCSHGIKIYSRTPKDKAHMITSSICSMNLRNKSLIKPG